MQRAVVLGSLLLLVAGCANQHEFVKETQVDEEKHYADMMACKSVMAAYSSPDEAVPAMDKCMADKGYKKSVRKYGY
jgi:hypothetical protein